MEFDDNYDTMFNDLRDVENRLMKKLESQINEIYEALKTGKFTGTYETRRIDEPELKGYIFHGQFRSNYQDQPFEPLRPHRRRPMPDEPFGLQEKEIEEPREALTDIFEKDDSIDIYVETPGEEEKDVQLKIAKQNLEIQGKQFHKSIRLPKANLDTGHFSSEYKNGLLRITIPKKVKIRDQDAKKTRIV